MFWRGGRRQFLGWALFAPASLSFGRGPTLLRFSRPDSLQQLEEFGQSLLPGYESLPRFSELGLSAAVWAAMPQNQRRRFPGFYQTLQQIGYFEDPAKAARQLPSKDQAFLSRMEGLLAAHYFAHPEVASALGYQTPQPGGYPDFDSCRDQPRD